MTRVLVTGFEPFDGQAVNASWCAVRELSSAWGGPADLVAVELPVSFGRAGSAVRSLLSLHRPDVVVCVGEAGGRGAVGIERVAVNVIDARIPDADGAAPVDVPVVAGGPVAYLTALPIKRALAAGARDGVPVEVSGSAGTYVCNAVFYELMHATAGSAVRAGFVHVPRTPGQVPDGPSLDPGLSAQALLRVVECALEGAGDLLVTAGTET